MESELEVLDAFIDGETVDAGVLKSALATPAGRDYFVDAWLLRDAAQREVVERAPAVTAAPSRRPLVARWLIAAGLAGGLLGGYALGTLTTPRPPQVIAPGVTPVVTAMPAAFPAPAPTRVIQLEFQQTPDKSGGN